MSTLSTTDEVIDALGGNVVVAAITETSSSAISNWRAAGKFPARTYLLLKAELKARNLVAPDYLWAMQMAPPKQNRKERPHERNG